MNAEASNQLDKTLWAYLHGELDDEDQKDFKQNLKRDPSLRKQLEEARQLDRLLCATLRAEGRNAMTDDELTKQALIAWERDRADMNNTPKDPPSLKMPGWFGFSLRAAAGIASLAASLYVLVSPNLRYSPAPGWTAPDFVPLAVRGSAPDQKPVMTPYSAEHCQTQLSKSIGQALKSQSVILPTGLTFSLRLYELPHGAAAVSVQAKTSNGAVVGDWTGDYSSVNAFLGQVDTSAAKIVNQLKIKVGTVVKPEEP